ncbi:UPF0182 family protein [Telmatobacter sp. DSM 110680]|uniref:UPF0182 protein P8935_23130 n=1 Tax=Telmatobacter sp. DSM 110680 TaxID=3036704 RepID=A0AAU7DKZ6_9BACT
MKFRRGLLGIILVVFLILFSAKTTISYYVDSLWFSSLGYSEVFWRTLEFKWAAFAIPFLLTFVVLYGWFSVLRHGTREELRNAGTIVLGNRTFELPVDPALRIGALLISAFIALLTGASFMTEWIRFALYRFAPSINNGAVDPIFGKSLAFYFFTLPVLQFVFGWLLMIAIVGCAIACLFIVLTSGSQFFTTRSYGTSPSPVRSLSASFAFLLVVVAMRTWLGRFDRILDDHTIFSGVTYTDAHLILSGLLVICAALLIGAAIAGTNLFMRPRVSRLIAAPVPAVICFVLVQLCAWYMNGFIVKPNELVREQPYISNNIESTRRAFNLDQVTPHEFPAEVTVESADAANNQPTLQNIRLWDWHALQDTLRQIQEIRTYYDFPDIDIDRYEINGEERQVMLAARELNVDKLPESSRNWINEKLIYTHGYGITMNPVNGFTPEGLPNMILSNMPIQSTVPSLQVKRPEIYFGQLTNSDVYVMTRQKEFDYPQGASNSMTSYQGSGGIELGSFLRRILIAFDRDDLTKLPFSDDINEKSRLLMRRNVFERVKTLAPFLTFDTDPYIVVGDDGRLSWILDAFTTSDNYPYSTHYGLGNDQVNYTRNSVKIVIDAYNGTTSFYVFDPNDPIISAYRSIFPQLFKDASTMPPDLRNHVRYPELLLRLQAAAYGLYHMTDPGVFYNREDLWTVASEVGMTSSGDQATQPMDPNFVLMKLPGESSTEFVEILPFTPSNRNNLIGWIAGRSDDSHYGTSVVYDFPKTRLVDGPLQVEARIDQNAQLSGQLTLWNQQGSHVRRGTLLVIPCGKALIYAEPIYLQAERSPMPELRLVVLALQDRLAYGSTFEAALRSLFGGEASSLTAESNPAPQPSKSAPAANPSATSNDLDTLIKGAAKDLEDYQRLTAQGKLGEAGQKLEQLKTKLDALSARQK